MTTAYPSPMATKVTALQPSSRYLTPPHSAKSIPVKCDTQLASISSASTSPIHTQSLHTQSSQSTQFNIQSSHLNIHTILSFTPFILTKLYPTPPPTITLPPLSQLLSALLIPSKTTPQILLTSFIYIQRFRLKLKKLIESQQKEKREKEFAWTICPRRVFLTSLILAHKWMSDTHIPLIYWARWSGLQKEDLKRYEMIMVEGLEWGLNVDGIEFACWWTGVGRLLVEKGEEDVRRRRVEEWRLECANAIELGACEAEPGLQSQSELVGKRKCSVLEEENFVPVLQIKRIRICDLLC